jgi:superfamily II DNA or RNA helicase
VGVPLSGVEAQSARYAVGLRPPMQAWRADIPLPFRYESTGVETFFTNGLDPEPRARRVFAFHRPETLAAWAQETETLRGRLRRTPALIADRLWGPQIRAITNLEQSLAQDRPRALIQMATGSGKTFTAVNFIYRLIKEANARRVLFLVDRNNLGRQAYNEFIQFVTPDDGRKFAELYNIRHLTNNLIDPERDVNRVYISTIQRLYALLKDEELEEEAEAVSLYEFYERVGAGLVPAQESADDASVRAGLVPAQESADDTSVRAGLVPAHESENDTSVRAGLVPAQESADDTSVRAGLVPAQESADDTSVRAGLVPAHESENDTSVRAGLVPAHESENDTSVRAGLVPAQESADDTSVRAGLVPAHESENDTSVRAGLVPAQGAGQPQLGQPQGLPVQEGIQQRVTVSFTEAKLPIEFFDVIVIDECHRSIYTVWRQVLEYFDAHLIGLTATPGKQAIGFFNQNLVMEYTHDDAVADGINVAGEVYRILTRISDEGSTVEAGRWVGQMDKLTRAQWQEKLDENLTYTPQQLDRDVVSESQMRTIIRHFRDVLFSQLFPDRTDRITPKTLIFAKDDNHAENIVRIVREEFGKGNDFCQKITYRARRNPEDILQDFRNSYHPRIAVTVDMIATGTDVRPIEILLFMRQVRSRGYFEQMRGRGTRVIQPHELQAVTADARHKTHFVLIDAVGLTEAEMIEPSRIEERKPSLSLAQLLENIAYGQHDAETVASLAHRLARLQPRLHPDDEALIADYGGGGGLPGLIHALLDSLGDSLNRPDDLENRPTAWEATEPFRANPNLRQALLEIQRRDEIVLDTVSLDRIKEAGFDSEATEKLRQMVADFQQFIADNKDELTALQILYNQPYGAQGLTRRQLQELAEALKRPPHLWTEEKLWAAYAQLERDKVRGVGNAAGVDRFDRPHPPRLAAGGGIGPLPGAGAGAV